MSKLDEQADLYHSALRSGQQWGIASLYAQKRMGEITQDMPATKNKYNVSLPLQNGRVGPCTGGALASCKFPIVGILGRPLHRWGIGLHSIVPCDGQWSAPAQVGHWRKLHLV